jgi:hypothetical protein
MEAALANENQRAAKGEWSLRAVGPEAHKNPVPRPRSPRPGGSIWPLVKAASPLKIPLLVGVHIHSQVERRTLSWRR